MVGSIKHSFGDRITLIIINIIIVFAGLVFLYPFWQTVVISFSDPTTATTLGINLWPTDFSGYSYNYVLTMNSLYIGFANSLFRTVVGTSISLTVTYFAAYALARREMPFKGILTFMVLFTMFFSGGLIPTYLTIKELGLLNTRWALILPNLISAWNVVIARNFIEALPAELENAAEIDGAGPLRILFEIMIPLSKPILAVLTLWIAVWYWNDWFEALIYCSDAQKTVLQLFLRRMLIDTSDTMNFNTQRAIISPISIRCAAIIVTTLPIACVYPFLQKFFMKGILIGAIKG